MGWETDCPEPSCGIPVGVVQRPRGRGEPPRFQVSAHGGRPACLGTGRPVERSALRETAVPPGVRRKKAARVAP